MNTVLRHSILRSVLALTLILQTLLPASVALAGQDNVSSYLCIPSNSAPTAETRASIKALLSTLGETPETNKPSNAQHEHCSNCILILAVLAPTPQKYLSTAAYTSNTETYIYTPEQHQSFARGPPLGGRAPPTFI